MDEPKRQPKRPGRKKKAPPEASLKGRLAATQAAIDKGEDRQADLAAIMAERQNKIESNIGLVGSIIRRIPKYWIECLGGKDDAFQYGLIGLIDAVELYDPTKGFAFSSYASRVIFNELLRDSAAYLLIRVPLKKWRVMYEETGPIVMTNLSYANLKLQKEKEEEPEYRMLWKAWWNLKAKNRILLRKKLLDERTNASIAAETGISKQRISQKVKNALRRLWKSLDSLDTKEIADGLFPRQ